MSMKQSTKINKISFVTPVYSNEQSLEILYKKIKTELKKLRIYKYEHIFVDDGSPDESLAVLLKLRRKDKKVKIIQFSRNFGQKMAVVAGLRESTGDLTICINADLQDPPEMVKKIVDAYKGGGEVIACFRENRDDGFLKELRSRIYYGVLRMSYVNMPCGGFDFFAISKEPLKVYKKLDDRNRVTQVDILWLGFNVKFLPYKRQKRPYGKSQYNFSKYLRSFIDGILDGSFVPIRFISLVGFASAFMGFLYALLVIFRYFSGQTPFQGYAPIVILILIIGGLLMIMLGILGEYIARIYHETRKRPLYVIKKKHG
jgi:dolichol-phosphate mannosyltransferase